MPVAQAGLFVTVPTPACVRTSLIRASQAGVSFADAGPGGGLAQRTHQGHRRDQCCPPPSPPAHVRSDSAWPIVSSTTHSSPVEPQGCTGADGSEVVRQ